MLDSASLEIVRLALAEDLGDAGDVTTSALVPGSATGRGAVVAKQSAVLAGTDAFEAVFAELDVDVKVLWSARDGDHVASGQIVAHLEGPLRAILTGERTALNFIQRLSGIATMTRQFVDAAPDVQIRDTRKTTPGMRALEKAAVRAGGGTNHRMGLYDAVLIKDNHLAVSQGVRDAVERVRAARPELIVEVECESLDDVREALIAGADEILLDNMDPGDIAEAVRIAGASVVLEASGGVTIESLPRIAATGVHAVSAGALTHSAPSIDFSLEMEPSDASRG